MTHVVLHLAALSAALVVTRATGDLAVRRLGWPPSDPLRKLGVWVLGVGLWTVLAFVLAAAGLLVPGVVWLTALGCVSAALWARSRAAAPPDRVATTVLEWAAAGTLGLLVLPSLVLAMTPVVSADAAVYHLTVPRLYVEAGGFRPIPWNVYSNWPLGPQLLYALALLVQDHVLAKLVHFAFGVLTLFAVVVGGRALHSPAAGWIAAPLVLANGVVAYELRVAYADLALAFSLTATLVFLLAARLRPASTRRALTVAGVAAALALSAKPTAVLSVVAVSVVAFLPLPGREPRLPLRPLLTRLAAPLALVGAAWATKAAWATGNPVYPFLHPIFEGRWWSPDLTGQLTAWQRSIGMGREPLDYLLLPVRVVLEGGRGYPRFDGELGRFWIVAVPLAVVLARRTALGRAALVGAGLVFAGWAATAQQMRFLIPALPLLALAVGVATTELVQRSPERWRRPAAGAAFAVTAMIAAGQTLPLVQPAVRTLAAFDQAGPEILETVVPPEERYLDAHVPDEARVLYLNRNQTFFAARETVADSFFEASQIVDWLGAAETPDEVAELLREEGVTHVVLDHRPLGIPYPPPLLRLLADPARARPLYRTPDGRRTVLELEARP